MNTHRTIVAVFFFFDRKRWTEEWGSKIDSSELCVRNSFDFYYCQTKPLSLSLSLILSVLVIILFRVPCGKQTSWNKTLQTFVFMHITKMKEGKEIKTEIYRFFFLRPEDVFLLFLLWRSWEKDRETKSDAGAKKFIGKVFFSIFFFVLGFMMINAFIECGGNTFYFYFFFRLLSQFFGLVCCCENFFGYFVLAWLITVWSLPIDIIFSTHIIKRLISNNGEVEMKSNIDFMNGFVPHIRNRAITMGRRLGRNTNSCVKCTIGIIIWFKLLSFYFCFLLFRFHSTVNCIMLGRCIAGAVIIILASIWDIISF